MHILELPSFFPPHGGLFCLEQAKALTHIGHEVRILSCVQLAVTTDKLDYWKIPTERHWTKMDGIDVYQSYMRSFPKLTHINMLRWTKIVMSMYKEYSNKYGKPDIIHAHCCKYAGIAAAQIARQDNIPFVITEHFSVGMLEKDFGKGWTKHRWLLPLLNEAYEQASCIITVSDELFYEMKKYFALTTKHCTVSNVIDTDFFAFTERNRQKTQTYRFCCLAIGNIYLKGYDILAKAWNNSTDCELHIAGKHTDSPSMHTLFDKYSNVTLHGHLDKEGVRNLLYHSDALVLPSRSEAQPLVLLEAMSSGIPVISTEVAPQCERIPGACYIVSTGDCDALQIMIQKFCETRPKTDKHFSEIIKSLASPQNVAKHLENIFTTALEQHTR